VKVAIAIVALLFVAAAASLVVGVHMLAGMAWTFIALGVLLFGAGVYLRSGLTPNG
jgi:hypothetical protein